MEMIPHYARLFDYDAWANRETLRSLRSVNTAPSAAVKRMAHIVGAGWLWLTRLKGEPVRIAVWPKLDLGGCEVEAEALAAVWRNYIATLSEDGLSRRVSYVNSKGEPWESTVEDILIHTTMHGTYHRGQIASDLRRAGFEPAYTDFIHAVRNGFLERREQS
jgi:uncharacterized damage-inducible protein DinB